MLPSFTASAPTSAESSDFDTWPGVPAMMRGAESSVSATGQSRSIATVAMKLAVASSIAIERGRDEGGCSSSARTASKTAATATRGAAKKPAKPSIVANAIEAIAIPDGLRLTASVTPRRIHGTSSKPMNWIHPRWYATAYCPESANTGAITSAASGEGTRSRSHRYIPSIPTIAKKKTVRISARSAPKSSPRRSVGETKRVCGAPTASKPPQ